MPSKKKFSGGTDSAPAFRQTDTNEVTHMQTSGIVAKANSRVKRKPSNGRFMARDEEDGFHEGTGGNDACDGDEMAEMIKMLQEFQKRKATKTSTRTSLFQTKLTTLTQASKNKAELSVREGSEYLAQSIRMIQELRSRQVSFEEDMKQMVYLGTWRDEASHAVSNSYPRLLEDLSSKRADDVNSASTLMENLPHFRQKSRRNMIKNARAFLDEGIENQKVATDASALIKHYKALLLA